MRILVCEYVTGGGLRDQGLPKALSHEGDLMLRALVKDLATLPGLDIWTTRDDRLQDVSPDINIAWVREGCSIWSTLEPLLSLTEVFWPIAPESDGALERLCRLAAESDCRLLASDPETLALSASKRATGDHLARHGVPTVATWSADRIGASPTGWVTKPDDGAGCEETHYFAERQALADWLGRLPSDHRFVVQPYVPGTPGSLSLLCRDGEAWLLACNRQRVTRRDNHFRYEGSDVGALEATRARYEPIAKAIANAMPGLWGYIGVDVIDAPSGPRVLEINPRLTTSYAALGQSIGVNPAGLVLALLDHSVEELYRPLTPMPCLAEPLHA